MSPNPTALLQSKNFSTMLETFCVNILTISSDSPPVGVVIDAAITLQKCDASILVTKAGETKRRDLQKAKEQFWNKLGSRV